MPSVNPTCTNLSASSIQAFKACPQRFRLGYREGLRTDRDTDSQRVGTNWHAMHEVYANALRDHAEKLAGDKDSLGAHFEADEYAMVAVVEHLNQRYADVPSWIDAHTWALERQVLLTSFVGYLWYWQNDPVKFLASEVPFNLPLHEPRTGMPLSMDMVQRVGKIDHVVEWHGAIGALERKSTSRSIAPDSDYWQKWQKDTQIGMYALAFEDMKGQPNPLTVALYGPSYEIPLTQDRVAIVDEADRELLSEHQWHANFEHNNWYAGTSMGGSTPRVKMHRLLMGCEPEDGLLVDHINGNSLDNRRCNLRFATRSENALNTDRCFKTEEEARIAYLAAKPVLTPPRFGCTLVDVWHKPTIKPCMLTQAETKALFDGGEGVTGRYQEQEFTIACGATPMERWVGGVLCEIEIGKKGFAIKETIEMFAARLLNDIYTRPDFYFARREIARTAAELVEFRRELFAIYQAMSLFTKTKCWFSNESQCRATYNCAYIGICYHGGADAVCDGHTTPPGYKRIFVNLTVNGQKVDE